MSGVSDKISASLLVLDRTHEMDNVNQHYSVSELKLIIDLASILGGSSERRNVIQVHAE